jgi:2-polyprenyl-3-methyl-5-hydroxy-6-metoxy-1,4-benzoquinol methylase
MDEWFKDWFNTDEYLAVYSHRDDTDAKKLVDLILKNVNIPCKCRILDLACGTGRHSLLFAQKNFNVTAVDLSKHLLSIAKDSAEKSGLNINFVNADVRSFCDSAKFYLVVNLFTSFGYFESDEENFIIFKSAFHHLEDGGFFVLDYFNKNFVINNLVPFSFDKNKYGEIIQKRSIEGNRVVKKITIKQNNIEKHFHESVRLYQYDELERAIKQTGLKIKKIFGNLSGNFFEPENSPTTISKAQK